MIARLNMGGPALHVAYLTEGLAGRGYDTTLVAGSLARGEDSMAFVAEGRGVEVVKIDELHREISPFRDLVAVFRLARLIRAERPQILHTHTAKAGAIGRLAALVAGKDAPPIVVHTFHGHVLHGYFDPVRTQVFRLLERFLARTSTALIAVSPQVRDDLVALHVAPAEKFTVVRLGIELDERVAIDEEMRAEARRVMGIPPDRFAVGWVGRMTGVKRTDDVVRAFAALRARGVDACLCIVGDGPDRDQVERRAHELGVIRDCLFLGYQEDVARFFAVFDAFVLSSVNEGTPVVAIEALAAGTAGRRDAGRRRAGRRHGRRGRLPRRAGRFRSARRAARAPRPGSGAAARDGRGGTGPGAAPLRRLAPDRRHRPALPLAAPGGAPVNPL